MLRGDSIYKSGSADLDPKLLPVLDRIGDELNKVPGFITVTGHTDNVPGGTLAVSVELRVVGRPGASGIADRLLMTVKDPARIKVEGVADSQAAWFPTPRPKAARAIAGSRSSCANPPNPDCRTPSMWAKLKRFFTNRWVLSAIGLLILSLLIWFAGDAIAFYDFRPLASAAARIGLIVLHRLLFRGLGGHQVFPCLARQQADAQRDQRQRGRYGGVVAARSGRAEAALRPGDGRCCARRASTTSRAAGATICTSCRGTCSSARRDRARPRR